MCVKTASFFTTICVTNRDASAFICFYSHSNCNKSDSDPSTSLNAADAAGLLLQLGAIGTDRVDSRDPEAVERVLAGRRATMGYVCASDCILVIVSCCSGP